MTIVRKIIHHLIIITAWAISVFIPVTVGHIFSMDNLKETKVINLQNFLNFISLYITYWLGFFMYKALDEKRDLKSASDRNKY